MGESKRTMLVVAHTGKESAHANVFEEPALLTLGICYEQNGRFAGAVYRPILVRTAEFIQSLGGGGHEIERLPKLPQKQLCLYRRVPVITSRTGSALHRECLEKLKVG